MRPWLLIDYDDTLGGVYIAGKVHGNQYAYSLAINQFNSYMAELGYDPIESECIRAETDKHLLTQHGFGDISRFGDSMLRTWKALASKKGNMLEKYAPHKIEVIGGSVFTHPYVALPGAKHTLELLGTRYNIAIVTKGQDTEQRKKIRQSGIHQYADAIFVLEYKNKQEWQAVLGALAIDTLKQPLAWAIGNSVKSDVNVPLGLGLNGIHIRAEGGAFEQEAYTIPHNNRKLHKIDNILQTLDHLEWR